MDAVFKFIAKNPPMACICGGIIFLLISIYGGIAFGATGWILIGLGVLLQYLYLKHRKR